MAPPHLPWTLIFLRSSLSLQLFLMLMMALNFHQSYSQKEDLSKYIEGVTGETLSLPCNVIPPVGDRVALILWYRDHQPDAVFTYDAREGTDDLQQTGPLKGRASFHMEPSPHLSLRRVSITDAGIYECRVDFLKAPSRTTILKVYVVEPPTNLVIKNDSGKTISFTLEATAGQSLRLSCLVTGGFPKPEIWWTLNDLEIDVTWEEVSDDVSQNDVTLTLLDRSLHQARLACYASNTNVTEQLRQEVTLLLNLPPSSISITSIPGELHSGRTYRALCSVAGSRPAPVITWKLTPVGGRPKILDKKDLSTRNQSQTWLEFKVDHSLDKATLSCSAMSPALPSVVIANSTSLNVVFAPRLSLALGEPLKASSIKEGIDVYFKCSVLANPPVSKIEWLSNGKEVVHHPDRGVVVSHDHLVLQHITRRWTGEFSCRASNSIGASSSAPLGIVVQYAPVCVRGGIMMRALVGQEISVPCRVAANPSNVTFFWTFSNSANQKQNMSEEFITWNGLESRLKYRPEKTDDYGSLLCWARNNIGKQRRACRINIKPADSPPPPVNCSVSNQTWESLEVTCGGHQNADFLLVNEDGKHEPLLTGGQHRGIGGGGRRNGEDPFSSTDEMEELGEEEEDFAEFSIDSDQPKYLLTVRERVSRALVYNSTGTSRVFSVSGLTPGLDYVITISRFNNHGRSSEVNLEALTLRTAENRMREKERTSNPVMLGAIVGALGLLIILGVAIILFAVRGRHSQAHVLDDVTLRVPPPEDDLSDDYVLDKAERDTKFLTEETHLLDSSCEGNPSDVTTGPRSRYKKDKKLSGGVVGTQPDLLGSRGVPDQDYNAYHHPSYLSTLVEDRLATGRGDNLIDPPRGSFLNQSLKGTMYPTSPPSLSITPHLGVGVRFESPTTSCGSRTSSPVSSTRHVQSPSSSSAFQTLQGDTQSVMSNKQLYVRVEGQTYPERESFL